MQEYWKSQGILLEEKTGSPGSGKRLWCCWLVSQFSQTGPQRLEIHSIKIELTSFNKNIFSEIINSLFAWRSHVRIESVFSLDSTDLKFFKTWIQLEFH